MGVLIRIIIMFISGGAIPFIANIIYSDFKEDFNNLKNNFEKIAFLLFYMLLPNFFIIVPSIVFFNCFTYIINIF